MRNRRNYSVEFKENAVKSVIETSRPIGLEALAKARRVGELDNDLEEATDTDLPALSA